jgi:uncharacterized LabA/DUF88 family protein
MAQKYKLKSAYPPSKRLSLTPPRFLVYIDEYNLYKGINHEDPPDLLRLGWSNYQKLGEVLVDLSFEHLSSQRSVLVKYFTAIVNEDTGTAGEIARQQLWLERLGIEAPDVKLIKGLHVDHSDRPTGKVPPNIADPKDDKSKRSARKEKMTDVNIAVHAVRDVLALRPAGIVLVSGDRDFWPVVEYAAAAGVPAAVFFPQDHKLYKWPIGFKYEDRVTITYLTTDIMKACRLSDERWLDYLTLKTKEYKRFQPCLDWERGQADRHQPGNASPQR